MRRRDSKVGGFTLIELIAVIVVLAILGAVAVPRFLAPSERQRQTALVKSLKSVSRALLQYGEDFGRLPPGGGRIVDNAPLRPYVDTTAMETSGFAPNTWWTDVWANGQGGELRIHDVVSRTALWTEVDRQLDDGNISSGAMWSGPSTQLKWIISR